MIRDCVHFPATNSMFNKRDSHWIVISIYQVFYVSGAACWAPTGCPAALLKRTAVLELCSNYEDQYKSY